MRYRLSTLLILLAVLPVAIYCAYEWGHLWKLEVNGIGLVLWLAAITGFAVCWPRPKRHRSA
jgi:hypothetical protein